MPTKLIPIADIIKNGWELYTENFQKFLIPILIMALPYAILFLLQYYGRTWAAIFIVIVFVSIIMIELWLGIYFILMIDKIYNKQKIDTNKLLEEAFKKIASYFWVCVLMALVIIAGLILIIIPGIIFTIWFNFAPYANVLENKKGITALKASKELVEKRWFATCWRLIVPPLLVYLIVMAIVIGLTFMVTGGQINNASIEQNLLINSLSTFIFILLSPLFISFSIILYNSLKETKQETL